MITSSTSSNYNLNCAVDTNILIAIHNGEDRLHQSVSSFLKFIKNLYIGFSVLDETVITFGRKIREVMGKILKFYMRLDLTNPEEIITREEEKLLADLNNENPRNENFHKFIIKKAREIRKKYNDKKEIISELMRFNKEISDANIILSNITNKIWEINENIEIKQYGIKLKDKKRIEKILKIIENIKFKDKNDKMIFVEVIVCYPQSFSLPLIFVSDDEEFIKKANRALDKLKMGLDIGDFSEIKFKKLISVLSELCD